MSATPERALRQLFLTVFLRGRSARGLHRAHVPTSVPRRLALTLLFYALCGMMAFFWFRQSVFVLSLCLHALTFVFLGTFVAASAGEMLFNRDENDILLHRPVTSRALVWAKMATLITVSLWIAGAFNLVGLFAGLAAGGGRAWYPAAHLLSTALVAALCTGSVVLAYELCLRWFGRERLDGLITFAQVLVAVAALLMGQAPRLLMGQSGLALRTDSPWMFALPPAWFAGLDDALAGSGAPRSWALASVAVLATLGVSRLALGRLARDYTDSLRAMAERPTTRSSPGRRRLLHVLVSAPPLSWLLRDAVTRSAFLLSLAYLSRNRDTKLRVYPGVVPMLILPIVLLGTGGGALRESGVGLALSGVYLGLIPMMVLELLRYSEDAAATDMFRAAPIAGPHRLMVGARWAVLCCCSLPLLLLFGAIALWGSDDPRRGLLLVPGVIAMPVYANLPALGGRGIPLSTPSDTAKAAGRNAVNLGALLGALALAILATFAYRMGWFTAFLAAEGVLAAAIYAVLRRSQARARWASLE